MKKLSTTKTNKNLTTDGKVKLLGSAREVAQWWYGFLSKKFAPTKAELKRPELEELFTAGKGHLHEKEILAGLSKMNADKATGLDGIPVEIYKSCPVCKEALVQLLQTIWRDEEVSVSFAQAKFVILYKIKDRLTILLNTVVWECLITPSYKVLTQCLLARLEKETDGFLSDWQAGFRVNRGCLDNILVLRSICDDTIEKGEQVFITFIDYFAAFDSVSHHYLDKVLGEAGATDKSRSITRAIYNVVSARTAVQGIDGEVIFSEVFSV